MSGVSTNEAKPEIVKLASMRVLGGTRDTRIHIAFAGLFESKTLLCVVNAYSKWREVVLMEKSTAESTIEELRLLLLDGASLFKLSLTMAHSLHPKLLRDSPV